MIVLLAVGVVFGVGLSFVVDIRLFGGWAWIVVMIVTLALVFVGRRLWMMFFALLVGMVLGCFRTNVELIGADYISGFEGKEAVVTGRVSDDPEVADDRLMSLRLVNLRFGENQPEGKIYVTVRAGEDVRRGDEVMIDGKMSSGFGSFAGSMYRAKVEGVTRPEPGDLMLRVRDWFGGEIRRYIPEPEVDLALGYLLGQRRALPNYLVEVLMITGLTHIVVASGYNLTILVRAMRRLFGKLSRFAAVFFAGLLCLLFVLMTGVGASMMRAGVVAGLSLLAWYYGRQFHPVKLLFFVAAGTLLVNPIFIMDVGWQLSFAAFAGVMILAPLANRYFYGKEKAGFIKQILMETVSAQVVTAPILIYYFGQISIVSVLANILILPTIPWVMLATFATGVGGFIMPIMAEFVGWVTTVILKYHIAVMDFFAGLPWAMREVNFGVWGVVATYVAMAGAIWYMSRATKTGLVGANLVE